MHCPRNHVFEVVLPISLEKLSHNKLKVLLRCLYLFVVSYRFFHSIPRVLVVYEIIVDVLHYARNQI
jgi:hypothetical protein